MNTAIRWALSLVVGSIMFACGGSEPPPEEPVDTAGSEVAPEPEPEPPPPPPPEPSTVRVINAAAGIEAGLSGAAGPSDAPLAQFAELAFPAASAYESVSLEGGAAVSFSFAAGEATAVAQAELRSGIPATVIVYAAAGDEPGLAATTIEDEAGTVTGQTRGRLVNAIHGADSIDLCIPGASRRAAGRPIFTNVAYGDVGGIPSFPSRYQPMTVAGVTALQIRASGERPCAGSVIGTVELPPIDLDIAHNLTMVATGRTGRRATRVLLICEDHPGDGACTPIPVGR